MAETLLEQKVQVLLGERGKKGQQAVRVADLMSLFEVLDAKPSAVPAGAAPTAEQYNALVNDLTQVYNALTILRRVLLTK